MKMKYLLIATLLCASSAAMANGLAQANPGQEVKALKKSEAQAMAAAKKAETLAAHARQNARIEEERAAGKPKPPQQRHFSLQ